MLLRVAPAMLVKSPPAYTVLPFTAKAFTWGAEPITPGFHEVALFVLTAVFNAAMRLRLAPPIVVKSPPAYNVVPLSASAFTVLDAFGFQRAALLVFSVASSAAMRLRAAPPMLVKLPPA